MLTIHIFGIDNQADTTISSIEYNICGRNGIEKAFKKIGWKRNRRDKHTHTQHSHSTVHTWNLIGKFNRRVWSGPAVVHLFLSSVFVHSICVWREHLCRYWFQMFAFDVIMVCPFTIAACFFFFKNTRKKLVLQSDDGGDGGGMM